MYVVKYGLINNGINMETRFCIEYVNPRHPLRDDGSINVRYDRVLTLEQAEHDLTLILSFGGKILDLYMGNVVDGETGEWSPKPMIVDDDDWFTTDWLKSLESKWKPSEEQMEHLNKSAERRLKHENIHRFRTVKKVGRDSAD